MLTILPYLLAAIAASPAYLADGKTIDATSITMIDGDQILLATADGEKAFAANELVKWGELRDTAQGVQVLLIDGSLIVASDVSIADEQLVIEANLLGKPEEFKLQGMLRLPLDIVRGVVFRMPIDALARDKLLARIASATGNADQVLLANGDVMNGTLKRLDHAKRDDDQLGPLTATLETTAGEVVIAPDKLDGRLSDKVAALIFNPQLLRASPKSELLFVVGLADGSRLFATRVDADDEQATFHLASGAPIASHPDENIWPKITGVQTLVGGAKYLSDLKGTGYKHVPLVGAAWPLGVDENVLGGNLRSGDRLYLRGLGMHAASRVVFALDRPYKTLQAELALDDSAGDSGSANVLVLSDATGEFKAIYKSAVIRGGDAPLPISLNVAGAKRIALIVEPADHGDTLDRVNVLDARLLGERGASAP
jgi:hypothetical protein